MSEEKTASHSIQPRRRVGDRYTWTISFDITVFDISRGSAADDDGIRNNVFEMREESNTPDAHTEKAVVSHYHLNVDCTSFRSSVLRHTYVAPLS